MSNSVYIYNVKIWAYDQWIDGELNGEVIVSFATNGSYNDKKEAAFPLLEAWVDPGNLGALNVFRAHASIPKFDDSDNGKACKEFIEDVKDRRTLPVGGYGQKGVFLIDRAGTVLIMGTGNGEYSSKSTDDGWKRISIYPTKAKALRAVIDVMTEYSPVRVSGVDLINLNSLSDSLLELAGFLKVPEVFGRGVDMWLGSPEALLDSIKDNSGKSNYSYSYNYKAEQEKARNAVQSFFDMLEIELNSEPVSSGN